MTRGCYQRVANIPAPLMDAFLDGFEERISITDEEEQTIMRQAAVLFSKDSRGVTNACEAVSLYCTLGNQWEKFGLNREALPRLPQREYIMLKMMLNKESESMKTQARASKPPTTRIATGGGRVRSSRGVRVGG